MTNDGPAGYFAPPAWLCCTEQEMLDARALERAEAEECLRAWRRIGADLRVHLDGEIAKARGMDV